MFQLRNHQNTVIDILSKNRKGQVIVPTGGGKTMCMIEDAKKVSGTVGLSPREQQRKAAMERRARKGGAKTPTASQLLAKKTKPKVSPDYKPQKASGLTRDERRKIKRAGQRLVKDMQKGRERPRSAYEPGMSIAMRGKEKK